MDIPQYKEKERIDAVCEYRYNQFIKMDDELLIHCHDYYELLFFPLSGVVHVVNGASQELPKGSLVLVRPADCHDIKNPFPDPAFIIHVAITKKLLHCMFEYLSGVYPSNPLIEDPMPPYVILDSYESNDLQNLLTQLNSIDYSDKTSKNIHMRSLLVHIFTQYFYKKRSNPEIEIPEWLIKTCNEMKQIQNFSQGIDRMVKISQRSQEHLSRSLKKYYNITPSCFINDIRLTYIANMLLTSDASIVDICYESGYTNLSWMYTLFKEKYGVSPAVFKKTNI